MPDLLSDAKTYYNYLMTINKQNNAVSQSNAREQMKFQERMSNTAHQREVKDLQAAGLNPVLSAGGSGGGASSASGAMGQTDMSTATALTGYLQSLVQQQTSMSVAQIQAAATRDAASAAAAATRYAADKAYESAQNNPNSWAGITRMLSEKLGLFGNQDKRLIDNLDKFFKTVFHADTPQEASNVANSNSSNASLLTKFIDKFDAWKIWFLYDGVKFPAMSWKDYWEKYGQYGLQPGFSSGTGAGKPGAYTK